MLHGGVECTSSLSNRCLQLKSQQLKDIHSSCSMFKNWWYQLEKIQHIAKTRFFLHGHQCNNFYSLAKRGHLVCLEFAKLSKRNTMYEFFICLGWNLILAGEWPSPWDPMVPPPLR